MDNKDRAAVHVASANAGQDVTVTYDPKYDSYTIDLRPKGPKHAKVTLNTKVVEKLIATYNVVKGGMHNEVSQTPSIGNSSPS